MQPFSASVCKSTVLFLCTLSLLGSWAVAQYDGGGTEISLRTLNSSQPHEATAPNYVIVDLSEKKLLHFYPELKGLQPADTQQDLPKLLERVGANVNLLLDSIPDVVCHEDVVQEQLDKKGFTKGLPLFTGQYKYLVLAHSTGAGIRLNEIRIGPTGKEADPRPAGGPLLAQGFGLLPLHFHPFHQSAAKFRYLGRQVVDNQNDYVVAFAQQREKAQLTGIINVDGVPVQVAYQGIAWINPDNFQIVRMRTDLLQPQPDVGLQETEVRLSEVRLMTLSTPLWLPHDVVVTRSTKTNKVREKHEFSSWKRSILEFKSPPETAHPAEKQK
jgi:hypothetical protein